MTLPYRYKEKCQKVQSSFKTEILSVKRNSLQRKKSHKIAIKKCMRFWRLRVVFAVDIELFILSCYDLFCFSKYSTYK